MKCRYHTVMFDLDGTLSDSAQGVHDGIVAALSEMGVPIPDLSDRSRYIGPPLMSTFQRLCGMTEERAREALVRYRKAYSRDGTFKNRLYEGMGALLHDLKVSGARVIVTTSKFDEFAKDVLDYLDIRQYFDLVCGSNLDGSRKEKAEVIRYAAKLLGCGITKDMVLIGDTTFDARGAIEASCDFIAVSYGYGDMDEIRSLGTDKLSDTADGLRAFLFL